MGQILKRMHENELLYENHEVKKKAVLPQRFPDLRALPPELSLLILSNLDATDLCLASCVWSDLGSDEILWHGLCRNQWKYATIYGRYREPGFSFKKLYLIMDEALLTFNADPELGYQYLIRHGIVADTCEELAKYIHGIKHVNWKSRRTFLERRPDVLEYIVKLQSYENQFLPNALRKFFNDTTPPNERNDYLSTLVETFSKRFCECNPTLGFSQDSVYVLCYSLIMLSVDLTSPHVKNKMSKREFIRNTRNAANGISDDFVGHMYDNVYLIGHVAPRA